MIVVGFAVFSTHLELASYPWEVSPLNLVKTNFLNSLHKFCVMSTGETTPYKFLELFKAVL